jgi:3-deoxy-D-arabino-heptulosonate 7-phosphate (DAHP) synthase
MIESHLVAGVQAFARHHRSAALRYGQSITDALSGRLARTAASSRKPCASGAANAEPPSNGG